MGEGGEEEKKEGPALPAGCGTWERSQMGARSRTRLSWTLAARRLKYSERTRMLSGRLAIESTLGNTGAAQVEATSADAKRNEQCIVSIFFFLCFVLGLVVVTLEWELRFVCWCHLDPERRKLEIS